MSCEIRGKGGQLIGKISDSMDDEEDYLMIDNKKVPLAEVYHNKDLKDSFNDSVKNPTDLTDNKE